MRFANKCFLVPGGARGIGKGIAQRLAGEGAKVVVVDVAGVAPDDRMLFIKADVAREPDVKKCVARTLKWAKRLDGVVNNAGLASPDIAPLEHVKLATWQRYLDVNLTGAFLFAKHALPHLKKTRGSIVNIGSTRAVQSEPNTFAYAASKGGIAALTHALAMSIGPEVRANCIHPGWIATPEHGDAPQSAQDKAQHAVGRVGTPDDIASLCAFLLGDEAGFITGAAHIVDGGMTRKMIYV